MKTITFVFPIVTLAVVAGCMGGCATPAGNTQTPAQIAAEWCPTITQTVTSMQALENLPQGAVDDLAKASKAAALICSEPSTADFTSLDSVDKTVLPALVTIVKASSLSPDDKNKVILNIDAAQIAITTYEAIQAAHAGGAAPSATTSK